MAKSFLGWNWRSMLSMAWAVRLTLSIESTATVICDSSIRSTVYDPCFSVEEHLAEAGPVGGQRNVHVLVEILGGEARPGSGGRGFLLGHADDPVEVVLADPDASCRPDRRRERASRRPPSRSRPTLAR